MSLSVHYRDWVVVPRWSVSVGAAAGAGCFSYRLEGSRPRLPVAGDPPPRVPFTDPHTDPVFAGSHPTANVPYSRQAVAYGRAAVTPHQQFPHVTSPTQQYFVTFVAAGPSIGIPSATYSSRRDPSYGGRVHFQNLGREQGRSAAEFQGEGCVIDVSMGGGDVASCQILFFDAPQSAVGGAPHFARRVQHAIESGQSPREIAIHSIFRPSTAVAVVGGHGSGFAGGITLFAGAFLVSE